MSNAGKNRTWPPPLSGRGRHCSCETPQALGPRLAGLLRTVTHAHAWLSCQRAWSGPFAALVWFSVVEGRRGLGTLPKPSSADATAPEIGRQTKNPAWRQRKAAGSGGYFLFRGLRPAGGVEGVALGGRPRPLFAVASAPDPSVKARQFTPSAAHNICTLDHPGSRSPCSQCETAR